MGRKGERISRQRESKDYGRQYVHRHLKRLRESDISADFAYLTIDDNDEDDSWRCEVFYVNEK